MRLLVVGVDEGCWFYLKNVSSRTFHCDFSVSGQLPSAPLFYYFQLPPYFIQSSNHSAHLQDTAKKRTRRTVKQQRGIVGAPLELIKDRRSQRPEAREAARKEAIAKGKEKKATAESKKKAEKAKSAAGAARGQPGRIQSKMGSKGVPNKASGKTR